MSSPPPFPFQLSLIGIGTGNPDHITRQGEAAINAADLILIPRKGAGKSDLAEIRHEILARVVVPPGPRVVEFDLPPRPDDPGPAAPGYADGIDGWHDAVAAAWQAALAEAGEARRVALLVWGDPSLFDSTLRVAGRLDPAPGIRVIPGISALHALTAAHAIPLNQTGAPVVITTGRRLREHGWPGEAATVVAMVDARCSFQALDPQGIDIWWGAFLGMKEELLDHGPLAEAGPRIVATRAAARAEHGWIMDIYLLRRRG